MKHDTARTEGGSAGAATAAACAPDTPSAWPGLLTLVINLDRAADRMAHMHTQLQRAGIPYTRVAAVDGAHLQRPHPDFSEPLFKYLHGRLWAPKELGCYLSHIQCLRTFLASDASHALILEDDVRFAPDLLALLAQARPHARHWNMLRLSTVNSGRWWPVRALGSASLAVCLTREKGAGGYLVDRVAARRMVDRLLPMRLSWDIAFDLEWLLGFRTLGLHPLPIEQNAGFGTDIQDDLGRIKVKGKLKYLTVGPFRLFTEVGRLLYRSYRLAWLRWVQRA